MQDQYKEGQLLDGSDGQVYVVRGGVPVPVDAAPGGVQLSGPDPKVALDRTKTTLEIQKAIRDAAEAGRGSLPQGYRFNAKGEAEPIPGLPKAQSATGKPLRQGDGDKLEAQVGTYSALKNGLENFQDDYGGNLFGGLENTAQSVSPWPVGTPGQREWWSNFRATDNVIRNSLYGASLTAGEKQAYDATTVSPSMRPDIIRQNLARRAEIIRQAMTRKVARFKAAGYNPAEIDAATGEFGAELTPDYKPQKEQQEKPPAVRVGGGAAMPGAGSNGPGGGNIDQSTTYIMGPDDSPGGVNVPTGKSITKDNPALAGVNAKLAKMWQDGTPYEQIKGYMRSVGLDPNQGNAAELEAFRLKNPGYRGKFSVNVDDMQVPMTRAQQLLNKIGTGPIGAATMSAANTMVPLAKLSGNPAVTSAIMSGVAENNPTASLAGTVGGGAIGAGATELGLGQVAARVPGLLGRILANPATADAAFGAAQGAMNAQPGATVLDTLKGAGAGVLGGSVGRGVTRGVAGAAGGVRNAAIDELQTRGIPLTVGQALSQSGRAGRVVKSVEDAMTSLPVVGNMVNARRMEGLAGLRKAGLNEALEPINATVENAVGDQAVGRAQDLVGGAYDDALRGVKLQVDQPYKREMGKALRDAGNLPGPLRDTFGSTIKNRYAPMWEGDTINGRNFQGAVQGLRKDAGTLLKRDEVQADIFKDRTNDVEEALFGLAERQAPGTREGLTAANAANRRLSIMEDAIARAENSGGMPTPAQMGMAIKSNAKRFNGEKALVRGEMPLQGLQRAAQDVLPSKVPDSGTTGRLLTGLALTGAGTGGADYASGGNGTVSASAAGTLALLSLLGTRRGQQALVAGLTSRPDPVRRAADLIARNQRWGGVLGAGATVPLLTGP